MRAVASRGAAGLADDLDVALALEEVVQAASDDLVVVEEEDADRLGVHALFLPDARRFVGGAMTRGSNGCPTLPQW